MSNNQLHKLARLAAGRSSLEAQAAASGSSSGNGASSGAAGAAAEAGPVLDIEDFRHVAEAAYDAVDVPDSVIDILVAVRNHLQVPAAATAL